MKTLEKSALISGARPVGLSLAEDLGARGIPCLTVDPQIEVKEQARASLRGPHSMGLSKRHGLAETILRSGLPIELQNEIRFVATLMRRELHNWAAPFSEGNCAMSVGRRQAVPAALWFPYTRVKGCQPKIEPLRRAKVATLRAVDARYGWQLAEVLQDASGVQATVEEIATRKRVQVRAADAAACGGGRSQIRRGLDVDYAARSKLDLFDGLAFAQVHSDSKSSMAYSQSARAHSEEIASVEAGRAGGLTCQLLRFTCEPAQLYERRRVLVRPAAHVACRRDVLPADAGDVWLTVTEHGLAIH